MVPGLSYVQTLIACALVALLVWAVQQARVMEARTQVLELRASLAAERAQSVAAARATERRWREAVDEIAGQFEREREDARTKHAAVVADLERGNLRMRAHWQGCQATADLSRAAESAARADELARLREQAAARIVRVGAECDAHVRGLQGVVMATRQVKGGNEKQ